MQHNVSLPAWSDAPELVKDGVLHVSIHVPAWGATHRQSWLPVLGNGFNPRSRVGSDDGNSDEAQFIDRFNPRSRVGSDLRAGGSSQTQSCFNPRSRVGSDVKEEAGL